MNCRFIGRHVCEQANYEWSLCKMVSLERMHSEPRDDATASIENLVVYRGVISRVLK